MFNKTRKFQNTIFFADFSTSHYFRKMGREKRHYTRFEYLVFDYYRKVKLIALSIITNQSSKLALHCHLVRVEITSFVFWISGF